MLVTLLFSAVVLPNIAAHEDIGRGKQAYQITTVQSPDYSAEHFQPGLAVDGKRDCYNWYSHTKNHQMPWWGVDLGDYYIIDYVIVTPRAWKGNYSGNFKILVGSHKYSLPVRSTFIECASGYGNQRKWLQCSKRPMVGRHVVVQRERERDVKNLCLCEVEIRGRTVCPRGRYAQNCTKECSSGCRSGECNSVDGACVCHQNRYRENCTGNCGSGCVSLPCDKKTGACTCKPGWQPPLCDKLCRAGYYGQDCFQICHSGCNGSCNPQNGGCKSCPLGWYGFLCDSRCETGCKDGSCKIKDGSCSCRPGYRGRKCDQECEDGKWGSYCVNRCSSDCESSKPCNKTNGSCTCKPGFTGMKCKTTCESGTYGPACTRTCSSHCIEGTIKCDPKDGRCSCRDGYKGMTCHSKCDLGFYGKSCRQRCGCLFMSSCNHVGGKCSDGKCLHGKKGPACDQPCEEGTFGINCESTCYCKGGHSECSQVNGTCASGRCVEGREGVACQKLRNDPTDTSGLSIGLGNGVSIVILLVVALVLLVIFIRRRRTRRSLGENDGTPKIVAFSNKTHRTEVKDEPEPENIPRPIPPEKVVTAEPVNGDVMSADVMCQGARNGLTYENMGIRMADFPDYVRRMKETEKGFQQEYESLPTGLKAPCKVGSTIEASVRNRFKNIIAYDHSRVSIKGDNPLSQYINANYIKGFGKTKDFIAAQGPVKETVADFIQMLWEQKVPLIVMVTNLKEREKPKCHQYWPDQVITGRITHRGITVRKLKEETFPHYVIRHLELEKDNVKQRLAQVQYLSWPDHGVPESPAAFLDFHKKAKHLCQSEVGPTVVHCSAGVGRTGTFLAVDYLLEQAKNENYLNVAGCVKRMREDRVNMVQSLDQYVFIHESVLEALHCGKTVYDASSYDAFASSLDKTELMKQYEILDKLMPTVSADNLEVAKREENINKNRSEDVLPNTKWRPLLMTDAQGTNDYINAVFVHAYQKKHAYIATQSPPPATVVDLWRLVQDYECSTIIALNDTGKSEVCPNYWGEHEQIGPFIISEETEIESNGYVRRQLKLKYKEEERTVMQFQIKSWTHGTLPAAATLLSLYGEVKAWQQESGDSRIIVHCLYGAAETGLYLCLCHVCDKIGREQEVDVFHAVQLIRKSQPLFITNLEQYEWLHQTAYEYISSFSMYANFK